MIWFYVWTCDDLFWHIIMYSVRCISAEDKKKREEKNWREVFRQNRTQEELRSMGIVLGEKALRVKAQEESARLEKECRVEILRNYR